MSGKGMEGGGGEDVTALFERDLATLQELFPLCRKDYLEMRLLEKMGVENRVEEITESMFTRLDWPKMEVAPEAEGDLRDTSRLPSEEYAACALRLLMNDFPRMPLKYLRSRFEAKRKHYLPTLEALQEPYAQEIAAYEACEEKDTYAFIHFRVLSQPRDSVEVDMSFTQGRDLLQKELELLRKERELERREREKREQQVEIRNVAIAAGNVVECGCCFEEEPMSLMVTCGDGHGFCMDCARRSAQLVLENSKTRLMCLESGCDKEFNAAAAKTFLDRKAFALWERRVAQAELAAAGIIGLEECPFCDFAMVIEDNSVTVFSCQNEGCRKESCRSCRKPSHIPLRCNEVEDAVAIKKRQFLHEKMTEALVRTCPACKKAFFKEEGCNHMKCPCGQSMCYVCRKPISGYKHFHEAGGCPLMVDTKQLNRDNVEEAKEEAEEIIAVEFGSSNAHDSMPSPPRDDVNTTHEEVADVRNGDVEEAANGMEEVKRPQRRSTRKRKRQADELAPARAPSKKKRRR